MLQDQAARLRDVGTKLPAAQQAAIQAGQKTAAQQASYEQVKVQVDAELVILEEKLRLERERLEKQVPAQGRDKFSKGRKLGGGRAP